MKIILLIFTIIISAATFCQQGEAVGAASFYLENNTSDTLIVLTVSIAQLGNDIDTTYALPKQRTIIHEVSLFGVNPRPSDTFKAITVKDSDGEVVFIDTKRSDSIWKKTKDNASKSDYYHCDYILMIE